MEIGTGLSEQIARYLDLAAAEAKVTAANIGNIDTPGYRALGFDFEGEMRGATEALNRGRAVPAVRLRMVDGCAPATHHDIHRGNRYTNDGRCG